MDYADFMYYNGYVYDYLVLVDREGEIWRTTNVNSATEMFKFSNFVELYGVAYGQSELLLTKKVQDSHKGKVPKARKFGHSFSMN